MSKKEKPKKVVGMRMYLKIVILGCFLLFNFFIISVTKAFISNLDKISERGNLPVVATVIVVINIFLIIFGYVLPYFLLKRYAKIRYYDDGFSYGKGEKNLYENIDYFFIPNTMKVNSFMSIWFKNNKGMWEIIPSIGYPTNGFDLFQKDFVKINYPKAMQKLENGETLEFLFNNPKKSIVAFGTKNFIKTKLNKAIKLKVTREALVLGNEVYKWNEYKISTLNSYIIIKDKDDNKILNLTDKALIHRVNLLEAIINTFSK